MSESETAWREAVSAAQAIVSALDGDIQRLMSALEGAEAAAGSLSNSTVSLDASFEDSVLRGSRLLDVATRGVDDVRRFLIDAANTADDLRRVLDFYHH